MKANLKQNVPLKYSHFVSLDSSEILTAATADLIKIFQMKVLLIHTHTSSLSFSLSFSNYPYPFIIHMFRTIPYSKDVYNSLKLLLTLLLAMKAI